MVDQTSQFYAILTNVGAAKQANADALGIAWKITQMGVGDANGSDPTPNATQTSLINEWRRAPLNQLKVDDKNSAIIIAEQVIPADVGGKWIREIALYDADGDMVAVANCAPTYKPLLSQGSGRTQVVRMNLVVSSASNVQLKIDPAVVLATREWVTEELARQDFKHSVVAATTANIALAGLQTVDGVALTTGARVLVKNQTAAKDNGLYLVAGGAWTRCSDADSSAKVTPGMLVLVERGMVNGDSAWQLVTDAPITLGVTALAYEMAFGRTGVASGTYRSVTVDTYGRVIAATNPTTVAGYGLTDVYTKTQIDQSLALKAPLASPVLTGVPTAPTPAAGTNTTQLATAAFVQAAIASLVASSPAALDTLNELAAALGNDPNFATTMTNALALKAPLASPTFSGDPKAPTAAATDNDTSLATTAFVRSAMALFGLGSVAGNVSGSIDDISLTGVYMVAAGTAGTKPTLDGNTVTAGTLLHMERGSSAVATQIWDSLVGSAVCQPFIRTKYGGAPGTWSPWQPIWHGGNTRTQPRQDISTQLATTEFVKESGFVLPSSRIWVPLGSTLGQEHAGAHLAVGVSSSSASDTIYLPASGIKIGSVFTIQISSGSGTLTLAVTNAPTGYISVGSTQLNEVVLTSADQPLILTYVANGIYQVLSGPPSAITRTATPYRFKVQYRTAGVYQWTVPTNVYRVHVEVRGGGGSGAFGTFDSTVTGPGGGGGGGISKRLCAVIPGSVITITVGAGGTAVSGEGESGVAGGSSSFGAFCSATGGAAGGMNVGAIGGQGTGGDFNASLGRGFPPVRSSGGTTNWGGQGGGGESIFAASDTTILTRPGMGGGGRTVTRSQAGAAGCVFITY